MQQTPSPNFLNLEYFFYKIYEFLRNIWHFLNDPDVIRVMKFIAETLIVIGIAYIFYWVVRLDEIKAARHKRLNHVIKPPEPDKEENSRLAEITKHLASENPSDWKLAIIEADVILDEIMARMRPKGESLADRLKQMNRETFKNLDAAWEAHLVRNRIAHDGSAFTISRPEARRIVGLYERVFQELGYLNK